MHEGPHAAEGAGELSAIPLGANGGEQFGSKRTLRSCLAESRWSKHVAQLQVAWELKMGCLCAVCHLVKRGNVSYSL